MKELERPYRAILATLLTGALWMSPGCQGGPKPFSPAQPPPRPAPLTVVETVVTPGEVTVAKLSNGLTVIIKPAHAAPVVCVRAFVRAGSLYEGELLGCGISHLVEHLVAEGAEQDGAQGPGKEVNDRIAEIGGQSNAFTSMDETSYYISAASGKTMECIDLVADWMARADISRAAFIREHGVVQREREQDLDSPHRQLNRAQMANVYGTHPAAIPVIGHAQPLKNLTYDDVLAYHSRMYVPQNIIFVVVGDVDAQAVLRRIVKDFTGFDCGRDVDFSLPPVEPLVGIRKVLTSHPAAKGAMETIAFQTIPLSHEDLYALDVLSYVLTEGESSRLVRKLYREKKLVTSVSSSSWTPDWGIGIFDIEFHTSSGKPAPGAASQTAPAGQAKAGHPAAEAASLEKRADAAEAAVLEELKAVVARGVTPEELERAKRQKIADFVYSQQTAESQSSSLGGDYLSTGDADFSNNYTKRLQAVTAEQVQKVAAKYFTFDRMAIARLLPSGQVTAGVAAEKPAASGPAYIFALPNELRVVLKPTSSGIKPGIVSMVLAAKGGLLLENDKTNGLGNLMAALSTEGAGNLTAEQIAEFFDRAGGSITGQCGNNTTYWQATVLEDSFDGALDIFADVICRPRFPERELEILRPAVLAAIERSDSEMESQSQKFFRATFFTGSPYRMMALGSKTVVEAATAEQLRQFHRQHIKAGSSVLVVCGAFDPKAAKQKIEKLFAPMPPGEVDLGKFPTPAVSPQGRWHVLKTSNDSAVVVVARPGMTIDNLQDRFAIDVLDTIISGYHLPAGWLHEELRGKQLVYAIHAYNFLGLAPGAFLAYAICQPEKAALVESIIRRNLDRAAGYLPTQEEVNRAVNTIVTSDTLENQTPAAMAMSEALDELYGFGHDFHSKLESYYRKVTPADVLRVGKKYLGDGYFVAVTTPKPQLLGRPGLKAQTQPAGETVEEIGKE